VSGFFAALTVRVRKAFSWYVTIAEIHFGPPFRIFRQLGKAALSLESAATRHLRNIFAMMKISTAPPNPPPRSR
jgi:hypothetical protein